MPLFDGDNKQHELSRLLRDIADKIESNGCLGVIRISWITTETLSADMQKRMRVCNMTIQHKTAHTLMLI